MIALKTNCLLFELANGESVPFCPEMISVEFMGELPPLFDSEFVRNAADAVVYYFKHELQRQTVTASEFAGALVKVLRGFSSEKDGAIRSRNTEVIESDLAQLMLQDAQEGELFFFPRLREQLRAQLSLEPREMHFHGLRDCVKVLAGAQRWTPRCADLRDQIVDFLRNCLTAEARTGGCALLVK